MRPIKGVIQSLSDFNHAENTQANYVTLTSDTLRYSYGPKTFQAFNFDHEFREIAKFYFFSLNCHFQSQNHENNYRGCLLDFFEIFRNSSYI